MTKYTKLIFTWTPLRELSRSHSLPGWGRTSPSPEHISPTYLPQLQTISSAPSWTYVAAGKRVSPFTGLFSRRRFHVAIRCISASRSLRP